MKKFFREFKLFINQGRVVDLAVGMIIGAAFTGIVKSFVNDIMSPVIGLFTKANFSDLAISIGKVNIKYGSFVMEVINFFLTAFVVFLFVKLTNKVREFDKKIHKNKDVVKTKICPYCKTEIDIEATRCPNCTSKLSK